MAEHTLNEYINAQRQVSLLAFGPIEGIYNTQNAIDEYNLIQEKKSKLPAKNRAKIVDIYENGKRHYEHDVETESNEDWDKVNSLVDKSTQLLKYLKAAKNDVNVYA